MRLVHMQWIITSPACRCPTTLQRSPRIRASRPRTLRKPPAGGLKPHLTETWKLSTDPQFIEKVRDVVGLYLDPARQGSGAVRGEKSQIQALCRAASSLPMVPGIPARATQDYVRHGTTSLFAAFEVASGS